MDFLSTPTKFSTGLLAAFAVFVIVSLAKRKVDTNLPLVFYFILMVYVSFAGETLNPYLIFTGLVFALLLRFEFLNEFFFRTVTYLEIIAICLIVWNCFGVMFGSGSTFWY